MNNLRVILLAILISMATSAGTVTLMNWNDPVDHSDDLKKYQCTMYNEDGKTVALNAQILAPEADVAVSFFDNMIEMEILKENRQVIQAVQGIKLKRIRCSI